MNRCNLPADFSRRRSRRFFPITHSALRNYCVYSPLEEPGAHPTRATLIDRLHKLEELRPLSEIGECEGGCELPFFDWRLFHSEGTHHSPHGG